MANVQCEHISYRLNNYSEDSVSCAGSPTEILGYILSGTGFSLGTCEISGTETYTSEETKTTRQMLFEFVDQISGELEFDKFVINVRTHRGSTLKRILTKGKNIKVVSKISDKRNNVVNYKCIPINDYDYALGDEVKLISSDIGINDDLRIVSISYDFINKVQYDIEISNRISTLSDDFYRIESSKITKDKSYYGTKLGPYEGLVMERADLLSKVIFNSDELKMQKGDGIGNYTDKLYFDPILGEFIFNGDIYAENGEFSGDIIAATITGGTITGTAINNGSGTFEVDVSGNLTATSAEIVGTITGSSFNTNSGSDANYIEINDEGFKGYEFVTSDYELNGLVIDSSGWADTYFYYRGIKYLGIEYSPVGVSLRNFNSSGSSDYEFLFSANNYTYPNGHWDFTNCDSISNLITSTQSDHNHGISSGTKLATSSDGINVDGNVTWVPSGSHYHSVSV